MDFPSLGVHQSNHPPVKSLSTYLYDISYSIRSYEAVFKCIFDSLLPIISVSDNNSQLSTVIKDAMVSVERLAEPSHLSGEHSKLSHAVLESLSTLIPVLKSMPQFVNGYPSHTVNSDVKRVEHHHSLGAAVHDTRHKTALMVLCGVGAPLSLYQLLVCAGGDLQMVDERGYTALDWCVYSIVYGYPATFIALGLHYNPGEPQLEAAPMGPSIHNLPRDSFTSEQQCHAFTMLVAYLHFLLHPASCSQIPAGLCPSPMSPTSIKQLINPTLFDTMPPALQTYLQQHHYLPLPSAQPTSFTSRPVNLSLAVHHGNSSNAQTHDTKSSHGFKPFAPGASKTFSIQLPSDDDDDDDDRDDEPSQPITLTLPPHATQRPAPPTLVIPNLSLSSARGDDDPEASPYSLPSLSLHQPYNNPERPVPLSVKPPGGLSGLSFANLDDEEDDDDDGDMVCSPTQAHYNFPSNDSRSDAHQSFDGSGLDTNIMSGLRSTRNSDKKHAFSFDTSGSTSSFQPAQTSRNSDSKSNPFGPPSVGSSARSLGSRHNFFASDSSDDDENHDNDNDDDNLNLTLTLPTNVKFPNKPTVATPSATNPAPHTPSTLRNKHPHSGQFPAPHTPMAPSLSSSSHAMSLAPLLISPREEQNGGTREPTTSFSPVPSHTSFQNHPVRKPVQASLSMPPLTQSHSYNPQTNEHQEQPSRAQVGSPLRSPAHNPGHQSIHSRTLKLDRPVVDPKQVQHSAVKGYMARTLQLVMEQSNGEVDKSVYMAFTDETDDQLAEKQRIPYYEQFLSGEAGDFNNLSLENDLPMIVSKRKQTSYMIASRYPNLVNGPAVCTHTVDQHRLIMASEPAYPLPTTTPPTPSAYQQWSQFKQSQQQSLGMHQQQQQPQQPGGEQRGPSTRTQRSLMFPAEVLHHLITNIPAPIPATLPSLDELGVGELQPPDERNKVLKQRFYVNRITPLTPFLFVSSRAAATNRDILDLYGITHIVNCIGDICDNEFEEPSITDEYQHSVSLDRPTPSITSSSSNISHSRLPSSASTSSMKSNSSKSIFPFRRKRESADGEKRIPFFGGLFGNRKSSDQAANADSQGNGLLTEREKRDDRPPIKYLKFCLTDTIGEDITSVVYDTCDFIVGALQENPHHKVLIHCHQGASRSVILCIMFLMLYLHCPYDTAYSLTRLRRRISRPNLSFSLQASTWNGRLDNKVPRSIYRVVQHTTNDCQRYVCKTLEGKTRDYLDSNGVYIVTTPMTTILAIGERAVQHYCYYSYLRSLCGELAYNEFLEYHYPDLVCDDISSSLPPSSSGRFQPPRKGGGMSHPFSQLEISPTPDATTKDGIEINTHSQRQAVGYPNRKDLAHKKYQQRMLSRLLVDMWSEQTKCYITVYQGQKQQSLADGGDSSKPQIYLRVDDASKHPHEHVKHRSSRTAATSSAAHQPQSQALRASETNNKRKSKSPTLATCESTKEVFSLQTPPCVYDLDHAILAALTHIRRLANYEHASPRVSVVVIPDKKPFHYFKQYHTKDKDGKDQMSPHLPSTGPPLPETHVGPIDSNSYACHADLSLPVPVLKESEETLYSQRIPVKLNIIHPNVTPDPSHTIYDLMFHASSTPAAAQPFTNQQLPKPSHSEPSTPAFHVGTTLPTSLTLPYSLTSPHQPSRLHTTPASTQFPLYTPVVAIASPTVHFSPTPNSVGANDVVQAMPSSRPSSAERSTHSQRVHHESLAPPDIEGHSSASTASKSQMGPSATTTTITTGIPQQDGSVPAAPSVQSEHRKQSSPTINVLSASPPDPLTVTPQPFQSSMMLHNMLSVAIDVSSYDNILHHMFPTQAFKQNSERLFWSTVDQLMQETAEQYAEKQNAPQPGASRVPFGKKRMVKTMPASTLSTTISDDNVNSIGRTVKQLESPPQSTKGEPSQAYPNAPDGANHPFVFEGQREKGDWFLPSFTTPDQSAPLLFNIHHLRPMTQVHITHYATTGQPCIFIPIYSTHNSTSGANASSPVTTLSPSSPSNPLSLTSYGLPAQSPPLVIPMSPTDKSTSATASTHALQPSASSLSSPSSASGTYLNRRGSANSLSAVQSSDTTYSINLPYLSYTALRDIFFSSQFPTSPTSNKSFTSRSGSFFKSVSSFLLSPVSRNPPQTQHSASNIHPSQYMPHYPSNPQLRDMSSPDVPHSSAISNDAPNKERKKRKLFFFVRSKKDSKGGDSIPAKPPTPSGLALATGSSGDIKSPSRLSCNSSLEDHFAGGGGDSFISRTSMLDVNDLLLFPLPSTVPYPSATPCIDPLPPPVITTGGGASGDASGGGVNDSVAVTLDQASPNTSHLTSASNDKQQTTGTAATYRLSKIHLACLMSSLFFNRPELLPIPKHSPLSLILNAPPERTATEHLISIMHAHSIPVPTPHIPSPQPTTTQQQDPTLTTIMPQTLSTSTSASASASTSTSTPLSPPEDMPLSSSLQKPLDTINDGSSNCPTKPCVDVMVIDKSATQQNSTRGGTDTRLSSTQSQDISPFCAKSNKTIPTPSAYAINKYTSVVNLYLNDQDCVQHPTSSTLGLARYPSALTPLPAHTGEFGSQPTYYQGDYEYLPTSVLHLYAKTSFYSYTSLYEPKTVHAEQLTKCNRRCYNIPFDSDVDPTTSS